MLDYTLFIIIKVNDCKMNKYNAIRIQIPKLHDARSTWVNKGQ